MNDAGLHMSGRSVLAEVDSDAAPNIRCPAHQRRTCPGHHPAGRGGLLTWASSFIGDQVKTQLSEQQIFFPAKGPATASPDIGPFLNQYAGQQLLTGAQAALGPAPMGMSAYTNAGSVWSLCGAPALSTPAGRQHQLRAVSQLM